MAVDPSIALGVQTPQFNPLMQLAQVAQLRDAQQRNQIYDLNIQDHQRQLDQTAALNKAYADNLGTNGAVNAQGVVTSLAQGGQGSLIPGVTKQLTEAQTAKLAQQKAQVELGLQHVNAIGQILGSVKDQPTYDAALRTAASTFGPDSIADLPAQYDPNVVQQHLAQTLTYKDQLDQHNKSIDQQLQAAQFGETQRHNQATEGNAAGQLAIAQQNAATEAANGLTRGLEYDAKNGVVVNKRTGQTVQVRDAQGNPIANAVGNLNGEQSNAVAFGARALDAQNTLRQLEAGGTTNTNMINRAASALPVVGGIAGSATNWLNNDQQQSYDQAKRNFVSAVLRKESGAAISESEFANEDKKYFPQAGDSPSTIEQKARARDLAIEGLKAQAGPGAQLINGIIANANQDYRNQPRPAQQGSAPAQIAPDAARAELLRRAANNPALAARLQAMGH